MKYLKIDDCDLNNGIGARVTLWVSGCDLHCKGCHNYISWDFSKGYTFTDDTLKYLESLVSDNFIKGLSILGGEPLHPKNRECVYKICDYIKHRFPEKDIWLWTGYNIDTFKDLPNVDYIIDGKFDIDKPTIKKWRGSDNQRFFRVIGGKLNFID